MFEYEFILYTCPQRNVHTKYHVIFKSPYCYNNVIGQATMTLHIPKLTTPKTPASFKYEDLTS